MLIKVEYFCVVLPLKIRYTSRCAKLSHYSKLRKVDFNLPIAGSVSEIVWCCELEGLL